jgi:hypothetical protein
MSDDPSSVAGRPEFAVPEDPLARMAMDLQPLATGAHPAASGVTYEVARDRSALAARWVRDLHTVLKR